MRAKTLRSYLRLVKRLEARSKAEVAVRRAIAEKEAVVRGLADLMRRYKTIGVINLNCVPTAQFKELRRALGSCGIVKVVKNAMMIKALEEVKPRNYEKLKEVLSGPNAFVFTNLNAFELARLCERLRVKRYAKPGDTATSEITIPSGPTGIQPGPSLSMFGKLKIPTQVREGFIWVAKDVTVARPGDVIGPELASILRKLGIKSIDVALKLRAVYDGVVLRPEDLKLDTKSVSDELSAAVSYAINLAINAVIPLPEVIPLILRRAHVNALNLSTYVGLITPENFGIALARALSRALALASVVGSKVPELGINIAVDRLQQIVSAGTRT